MNGYKIYYLDELGKSAFTWFGEPLKECCSVSHEMSLDDFLNLVNDLAADTYLLWIMDELGDHCTVFPDSVKDWARYNVRRYQDQHAIELFVNVGHLSAVDFR